jgi:hypothetical protein
LLLSDLSGAEVDVEQIGISQVGIVQVGTAQVGTVQVGIAQVGMGQLGVAQAGTFQSIPLSSRSSASPESRKKRVTDLLWAPSNLRITVEVRACANANVGSLGSLSNKFLLSISVLIWSRYACSVASCARCSASFRSAWARWSSICR